MLVLMLIWSVQFLGMRVNVNQQKISFMTRLRKVIHVAGKSKPKLILDSLMNGVCLLMESIILLTCLHVQILKTCLTMSQQLVDPEAEKDIRMKAELNVKIC